MRVFVSSVRRGLEEERDALPSLISATGHEPARFEDFTAQSQPSREACLQGVASSDCYLLLLGEHYGTPLPDTGKSPTEEEFDEATRRGLPRLVFRKRDAQFEPAQAAFAGRIGAYESGIFWSEYVDTSDLLTKVVAALRAIADRPTALDWVPLEEALDVPWIEAPHGQIATQPLLEVHIANVPPRRRTAREMQAMTDRLSSVVREQKLVANSAALNERSTPECATVTREPDRSNRWNDVQGRELLGTEATSGGWVNLAWTLPGDRLGRVLDKADLTDAIATSLRFANRMGLDPDGRVAVAVGITSTSMVTIATKPLTPRSSVSFGNLTDRPVRIEPDETMSSAALSTGAEEAARILSQNLIDGCS